MYDTNIRKKFLPQVSNTIKSEGQNENPS
jgi:hypothetical protein